jgi:hypothetical protein
MKYLKTLDERERMTKGFIAAGKRFRTVKIRPYGLLVRLERLIGKRYKNVLTITDSILFIMFPPLKYLCRFVLAEYYK